MDTDEEMIAITHKLSVTPEEYLCAEESALDKHEWIDGQVVAMAGVSLNHSLITANLGCSVGNRLTREFARALLSNIRVRVATGGLYTYPDVTVFCGQPQFDSIDRSQGTLTNPRVIVEVLSPSTEGYDRGDKFKRYCGLPSLMEYVLISQNEAFVEVIARRDDGSWSINFFKGLEAIAKLDSIGIEVPLTEIYDGVVFSSAQNP